MKTKVCTKCGEEKSLEAFYYFKKKAIHMNHCKECHIKHVSIRALQKDPERSKRGEKRRKEFEKKRNAKTKVCTQCKIEKPIKNFTKLRPPQKGYRAKCKQCCTERAWARKLKLNPNYHKEKADKAEKRIRERIKRQNAKTLVCVDCRKRKYKKDFTLKCKKANRYDKRCKKCSNTIYRERNRKQGKIISSKIINDHLTCDQCKVKKHKNEFRKAGNGFCRGKCKECESANNLIVVKKIKSGTCSRCKKTKLRNKMIIRTNGFGNPYVAPLCKDCQILDRGKFDGVSEIKRENLKKRKFRICVTCKEKKLKSDFINKDSKKTDQLSHICRDCINIHNRKKNYGLNKSYTEQSIKSHINAEYGIPFKDIGKIPDLIIDLKRASIMLDRLIFPNKRRRELLQLINQPNKGGIPCQRKTHPEML